MYDRRQHARLPVGERQRFIVARQDATYANPYGFPDLSMCFWPATFMRGGLKFWVQFTEKYGSPWVIGKHPRGANDEETDLLLDSLEAMVQDAVAAIPDDASVQIIEAAGKAGSADVYRQLLEYCRSEINVAMLGQNQTTEKDSNRWLRSHPRHPRIRRPTHQRLLATHLQPARRRPAKNANRHRLARIQRVPK